MLKINILLLISLIVININLNADNNFKDIEYLANKYKVRYTVEMLSNLKKKYPVNSQDRIELEKVEQYFANKLPVDSFGTFTKIKLHNIIEKSEKRANYVKPKPEYKVITGNTNLEALVKEKEKRKKELEKQSQNLQKASVKNSNPFTRENFLKSMEELSKKGEKK